VARAAPDFISAASRAEEIAAVCLGAVHREAGVVDHFVGVHRVAGMHRNANARRQRNGLTIDNKRR